MGRGQKKPVECDGQLSIFDFCSNINNYVVQHNKIIEGRQTLNIKSAKLIRATIMQTVRDDEELKPYVITIADLAKILGLENTSNLYRDIDAITDEIIANPLYIKEETSRKQSWVKIPWVAFCRYDSDVGVVIQLNDALKPYLLGLKNHYTQYPYFEIMNMKCIYSIRISELIQNKIYVQSLPPEGVDIDMTIDEIRIGCNCETIYLQYAHLKTRVIDKAVEEINERTFYKLSYTPIKKGRPVVGIRFHLTLFYH